MRNLTAAASLLSLLLPSVALAAPEALRCKAKYDPAKPDSNPDSPGFNVNCFADEVFILDGSQVLPHPTMDEPNRVRSLVDCGANPIMPAAKDPFHCFVGEVADQNIGAVLRDRPQSHAGADAAEGAHPPDLGTRSCSSGPTSAPRSPPRWRSRGRCSSASRPPSPAGRSTRSAASGWTWRCGTSPTSDTWTPATRRPSGEEPVEDVYEACGQVMSIPIARFFNDATLCPPGLFTYFDALAQATAMIYGPYLTNAGGLR